MIGIDANFLIACELQEHPHHEAVHKILSRLAMEGERFALAPQVLAEFLHIVTDGRRLEKPQTMRRALERAELWRTAMDVDMLVPGEESLVLFFRWMAQFRLAGSACSILCWLRPSQLLAFSGWRLSRLMTSKYSASLTASLPRGSPDANSKEPASHA